MSEGGVTRSPADTTAPSPYDGTTPVASLAGTDGVVTLVEGQTFAVSDHAGDMHPGLPLGLFVLDTRVLTRWELRLNGEPTEALAVATDEPFAATFVSRGHPARDRADGDIVVFRHRHIGRGMRERVVVTNHGLEAAAVTVDLHCDADFADLFEVKESRVAATPGRSSEGEPTRLRFTHRPPAGDRDGDGHPGTAAKVVDIGLSYAAEVDPGRARWRLGLDPGQSWEVCMGVTVSLGGTAIEPRFRCDGDGDDAEAVPAQRLRRWRARLPSVTTDNTALAQTLHRSGEDLGALRIFDPDHPDLAILAAGAPWFMTVFGRDSLLTAWMTLVADPSLARGVLETLARFQGEEVDDRSEEEPGKILHEIRFGAATGLALGGGDIYYGSIDATPLFVMLLGELRRWDPRDELADRLMGHCDRALAWIAEYGDRDGDGYVEYERRNPRGLANQGWKDSWDAVRSADGRPAPAPIALCEVQGYVYAAYVARAHFAEEAGDDATAQRYVAKARELRRRFNEDFWIDEHGYFALALDADKRPVDALASNLGHCLWTGIVEPEKAAVVADRLLAPDLFSGWGLRTLSTTMAAYNPVSYHNGSVWPHDNAICAAGLARYGFAEHAQRLICAQLGVAEAHGGRLPELFAGFSRATLGVPADYPTSCSPQAWAAASPLLWLRTLLRLDPFATHDQLWVHPQLPPEISCLRVEGIQVAGRSITIDVEGDEVAIEGAEGLEVIRQPRAPLTAALVPPEPAGSP